MARAYLGLGSNLGNRYDNIRRALAHLQAGGVKVLEMSSLYETEPVGFAQQPRFLNAACCAETELAPLALLELCKEIEAGQGRQPSFLNAPRPIDVDILFYDDVVLDTPALTIPHPRLPERAFVLIPLAEIAPGLLHPVLKRTMQELAEAVGGKEGVRRWEIPEGEDIARRDAAVRCPTDAGPAEAGWG